MVERHQEKRARPGPGTACRTSPGAPHGATGASHGDPGDDGCDAPTYNGHAATWKEFDAGYRSQPQAHQCASPFRPGNGRTSPDQRDRAAYQRLPAQ